MIAGLEVYKRIREEWVNKTKYILEDPGNPEIDITKGFGCWGWVWYFSKEYGLVLPKESWKAQEEFQEVEKPAQFLDIIGYLAGRDKVHIGSMLNDHLMVHCSKTGGGVTIDDTTTPPWNRLYGRPAICKLFRHRSFV